MSELAEEHILNRNPDQEEVNSNTQTSPGNTNINHSIFPTFDDIHITPFMEEVEFVPEDTQDSAMEQKSDSNIEPVWADREIAEFVRVTRLENRRLSESLDKQMENLKVHQEDLRVHQEDLKVHQSNYQRFTDFVLGKLTGVHTKMSVSRIA